ncbi:hypothetical protein AMTRI_Chr05g57420 [Amborella trichopoda]|uniref:Uncharacterized protein n=1 Tax=Amborella trichopoda TaxID=13333 RepID=W1NVK7_AMBTC|nr:transmembrane protein 234 homolog [Amborella trichopoda]ERM98689.1 hypothetical protein AMTR_s00109p00132480 [Amborella trichopoda]|eukprot:XP_006833411.1 transmembrane protein 234 homolog [Amborella trichopoda]
MASGTMIVIGLVWGATNALMRRGALIWDQKLRLKPKPTKPLSLSRLLTRYLKDWFFLLLTWQYSLPFLLNLTASASFFFVLSETPISVAVPVTNAVTFASTALFAMVLGEEMRVLYALMGTALITLGVWLCISSNQS